MIIGICGKSGSGKSTLASELIEELGPNIVHLDIDKIGHQVLSTKNVKNALVKAFGAHIINNNIINRSELSDIVFSSKEKMQELTDITWPYMQEIIDNFLKKNSDKIIILDWQLLPITKYFNMCNLKLLLDIPYEIRKERIFERNNISNERIALRERASITYDEKSFDYVISNINHDVIKTIIQKTS